MTLISQMHESRGVLEKNVGLRVIRITDAARIEHVFAFIVSQEKTDPSQIAADEICPMFEFRHYDTGDFLPV
jgi:hypothetical protein